MEKTNTFLRYSEQELEEFKEIILQKMAIAKDELDSLSATMQNSNASDSGNSYHTLEDGADTFLKESIHQLAGRQKKFIEQLEAALVRIENKTYGICRQTGKLIQKERLMAVPHTTLSIEAKLRQN